MREDEIRRAALTAAVTLLAGTEVQARGVLRTAQQFEAYLRGSLVPAADPACSLCSHPEHDQSRCEHTGCECLASRTVKSTPAPKWSADCTCLHSPGIHNEHGCYSHACACRARRQTMGTVCPCQLDSKHAECRGCGHVAHDPGMCRRTPVPVEVPLVLIQDPSEHTTCSCYGHEHACLLRRTGPASVLGLSARACLVCPCVTPPSDKVCSGSGIASAYPTAGCAHDKDDHGYNGCTNDDPTNLETGMCPCERKYGE